MACTWTIYIHEFCNAGVCLKVLSPQLTLHCSDTLTPAVAGEILQLAKEGRSSLPAPYHCCKTRPNAKRERGEQWTALGMRATQINVAKLHAQGSSLPFPNASSSRAVCRSNCTPEQGQTPWKKQPGQRESRDFHMAKRCHRVGLLVLSLSLPTPSRSNSLIHTFFS